MTRPKNPVAPSWQRQLAYQSMREDLLKDATALVPRVEFQDSAGRVVVIGLRLNGAGSIYFDDDPVYQFNDRLQLRRAFHQGRLWKAAQGKLVALERHRADAQVALRGVELDPSQQWQWLSTARQEVSRFRSQLAAGAWTVTGTVPDATHAVPRIVEWLEAMTSAPWVVAQRPHVGGLGGAADRHASS